MQFKHKDERNNKKKTTKKRQKEQPKENKENKRTTKEKCFWIFEKIKGKEELKETQQKYFWNFCFFLKKANKNVKTSKGKTYSKFQQSGNQIHFQRKSKTNEEIFLLFSQHQKNKSTMKYFGVS